MRKIKIGGQFSGVGAFDYALKGLGIEFENVYQAEWDKYARTTYLANHSEPEYYVHDVYDTPIDEITEKHGSLDILMSSPPCQAFSLAGNRLGEDDDRGILFYQTHKFIKVNRPRFFILENVKGLLSDDSGRTFGKWVEMLGGKSVNGVGVLFPAEDSVPYHVYHTVLNAKDYNVPQNRERVFIVGIRDDEDNNFRWAKPMHLQTRLKDVLEDDVDDKFYLSDKMIENISKWKSYDNPIDLAKTIDDDISFCLTSRGAGEMHSGMKLLKIKSATKKGYETAEEGDSINLQFPDSKTRRGRVGKEVAQTLETSCNQGVLIGAFRGRNSDNPSDRTVGSPTQQRLEINKEGTSNTITSVQKDNMVVEEKWIADYRADEGLRKRDNGISPCITSSIKGGEWDPKRGTRNPPVHNFDNYRIRKLTPREAFRLMDFPDSFDFSVVSDTQAYKQAGNSIVVAVLAGIIKNLKL